MVYSSQKRRAPIGKRGNLWWLDKRKGGAHYAGIDLELQPKGKREKLGDSGSAILKAVEGRAPTRRSKA